MKTILMLALLLGGCASQTALQRADLQRTADDTRVALAIPGLSMAVVRDGKIELARGFGLSDVDAKTPATAETLYPIGSITKTFTATLMLQLAEEGRLDLDAEVAKLVDWEVAEGIRVRHVLSHTSESAPPGTRFAYSSRFNWLDNVVETSAKESFRELLQRRVLDRAALARTLGGEETEGYAESLAGLARPYDDGKLSRFPPMALHSSSGLSSTVLDLARYSIALDEGRLLSAAARERAYSPSFAGAPYGLGWYTQTVNGERVVWHTSWWPDAYSGLLVKVPSRGLTLVLLANSDALVSPQQGATNVLLYPIANAFLQQYLGGVPRGMTLAAQGKLREALDCCAADLATIGDDDRLKLFAESADPLVRAFALDAGRRLLVAHPDDLNVRFNLALAVGSVRPALRISGAGAGEAVALLRGILDSGKPLPRWMEAWTAYLIAEQTGDRALAERAKATGVDTDGLQGRVGKLLER